MDDDMASEVATEADAALLRLVQQRDESALALLYENRGRLVYSLALGVVHNESDAEEITQEAFFRLWQKAHMFDRKRGSVLSWLVTITRRLAIDRTRSKHYKSHSKQVTLTAAVESELNAVLADDGTARITLGVQAREVLAALERLDGRQREVIQLSYFQGLSHAQIANHLDAPLGTVKSRLRDALSQLRQVLDVRP